MLEIRDLHVSYGKVEAVRGVSVAAQPGRITLMLGANGAGKTTTLRAVIGLLKIVSGSVKLDGVEIANQPTHRLVKRGLTLVPEGRRVFAPLSVEENLLMGGYTRSSQESAKTLEQVYEMFPILYERRSGAAGLLSGGEQQMLAFGRALMAGARYILMDEPSMGLAPTMIDRVMGAARDIANANIGVLMVEQNADAGLEVADNVVAIANGEVAFSGSVEEARSDKAILRAFLGEAALTN